jgi:MFS family permease
MRLSKAIFLYILVALFLAYEMAEQVSPGIMTHQLMRDLGLNALTLGVMSGMYFFTYTIMQIPAGLVYDRYQVRYVVAGPIILCALGALLLGHAPNLILASLGRMLMGVGGAFAFIAVLVVAADVFPARYFALVAGITQLLAAVGAMGGQLPLVPLVHAVGWRVTLFYIAAVGFVLAVLTWIFLRYQRTHAVDNKKIPIKQSLKTIFSNRQTWIIALYACLLWAPMAAVASLWGVPFLMAAGLTHATAATVNSFLWVGIAIGSPLLGWCSDLLGRRCLPLMLSALIGLLAFVVVVIDPHLPFMLLCLLFLLAGAACAGQVLSFAVVKENNQTHNYAAAIGFNNMAVVIAGALFQPLIGKLLQAQWQGVKLNGVPVYLVAHYQMSFMVIVGCYLVAMLLALFGIRETYCRNIAE